MIVEREHSVGDLKELRKKLARKEISSRYFNEAEKSLDAIMQVRFLEHLEMDKPALYIKPQPIHKARFFLQPQRILVEADSELKGNQLIDSFIFNHLK